MLTETVEKAPPALTIGPFASPSPVVLAPMAGITNQAFRRLCRQYGPGFYVCEMITTRALVERNPNTMRLIQHHESESPRSIQLYGVDPATMREAVTMLVAENLVDHIDMNFGCPVPKVMKKGGGAALPWKLSHFRDVVGAAVSAAGGVPVTVKMRKGIDADHMTYLDAAKAAEDVGAAAVALHARTAAEHYSGHADWPAIATLKEHVTSIPVLGNGDIWSAADARRMMTETGCDGVVVGRGCLGRPWLFGELAAEFTGEGEKSEPMLGEVGRVVQEHAKLLVEFFSGDELWACKDLRKHTSWYFKGYAVGPEMRRAFAMVSSLAEIDDLVGQLDADAPYPGAAAEGQRGRAGTPKRPHLPEGWLDSRDLDSADRADVTAAEAHHSGG